MSLESISIVRFNGASVSCGAQNGLVGLEMFVAWFFPNVLCSWDRSGEETGSKEEMGAFLSTGEGERDFTNGDEGKEPAMEEVAGDEETFTTDPAENETVGLVSRSSSSVSISFVGLGIDRA